MKPVAPVIKTLFPSKNEATGEIWWAMANSSWIGSIIIEFEMDWRGM